MTSVPSQYAVYSIRGLATRVLGESYVVTTAYESSQNELVGEFFVLTKLPEETLNSGVLKIKLTPLPPELEKIDLEFVLREGLCQAEVFLSSLLEKRAVELSRPDVEHLLYELKPTTTADLLRCWMNEKFKTQLEEIKIKTGCRSLAVYLGFFSQVGPITREGWHAI